VCYELKCVTLGEFFLGELEFDNNVIFFIVTYVLGYVDLQVFIVKRYHFLFLSAGSFVQEFCRACFGRSLLVPV
jgi:hypothetical protein